MTGHNSEPWPLQRRANCIIALFLLIQLILFLRPTVPLPGIARSAWPWHMFSHPMVWERELLAIGIDKSGARHELPLERIFGYTTGASTVRVYDYLAYLDDPAQTHAQALFAAYLARRMAELGVELTAIDLRWVGENVETGETHEEPIGMFDLSAPP